MHIQTKNRIALGGLYAAGVFAACIFLLVRIRGAAEWVVYKNDYYNARDLYKLNYIAHFRESHPAFDRTFTSRVRPYRERPEHPAVDEADLLIFGDSFMNFRLLPSFPELLGQRLGKNVHFSRDHYPRSLLEEKGFMKQSNGKMLLYAVGERGIREGFYVRDADWGRRARRRQDREQPFFQLLTDGRTEERYSALLQLSLLTHRMYKWIATRKFDWFGYISRTAPVYSMDPPILFLHSTVDGSPNSIQYQHPQEEIDEIVRRIARLHADLAETYGLDMVFMGIPNKISIHHDLVWEDARYNDFLPRIQKGLKEHGVPFVDLYGAFSASDECLYFLSDTHWNEKGIALALDETITFLEDYAPDMVR